MNANPQPSRRSRNALRTVGIVLFVTVLPFGLGAYARLQPQTPADAIATPAVVVPLAAEFAAIRPADLDDTPPPIPPSELWPNQFAAP